MPQAATSSDTRTNPDRPADHVDNSDGSVLLPRIGISGWLRWVWRQLTSMRTALLLLLLLAVAAIPGSLFPQRSSDPNGVVLYFKTNPGWAPTLDSLGAFNVYTSVWFSAIYLLLFASLIGCVIPRTRHHLIALRQPPPVTPSRLRRLDAYEVRTQPSGGATATAFLENFERRLRRERYRVRRCNEKLSAGAAFSLSAERGYGRETGNLIFHVALIGILVSVAIGGGFSYTGQRAVVEGQSFVNTRSSYDSFSPGRFFSDSQLDPYSFTLNKFSVTYATNNPQALGMVTDYNAAVTIRQGANTIALASHVKVNEPLNVGGAQIYLLGNGYAPEVTVRSPSGKVVFADTIPFLPQDTNLTSLGVVKVPDGLKSQVGMIGFFYPTAQKATTGALYSVYPDLQNPVMTMNVYIGNLGINNGDAKSVYALDTNSLTQVAGVGTNHAALQLKPGQTEKLPNGLGSITFNGVKRFASFQVAHDPTQGFVLGFAIILLLGLAAALFLPRRRIWVRITHADTRSITVEYAGLSRGDDPRLVAAVRALADGTATTTNSSKETP